MHWVSATGHFPFYINIFSLSPFIYWLPDETEDLAVINRIWGSDGKEVGLMLFHKKERGQGMVEYALLVVLLAIVVVFMIDLMGTAVSNMYSSIVVAFPVH
jgi:pilus assembly protein Flp/PilA